MHLRSTTISRPGDSAAARLCIQKGVFSILCLLQMISKVHSVFYVSHGWKLRRPRGAVSAAKLIWNNVRFDLTYLSANIGAHDRSSRNVTRRPALIFHHDIPPNDYGILHLIVYCLHIKPYFYTCCRQVLPKRITYESFINTNVKLASVRTQHFAAQLAISGEQGRRAALTLVIVLMSSLRYGQYRAEPAASGSRPVRKAVLLLRSY